MKKGDEKNGHLKKKFSGFRLIFSSPLISTPFTDNPDWIISNPAGLNVAVFNQSDKKLPKKVD